MMKTTSISVSTEFVSISYYDVKARQGCITRHPINSRSGIKLMNFALNHRHDTFHFPDRIVFIPVIGSRDPKIYFSTTIDKDTQLTEIKSRRFPYGRDENLNPIYYPVSMTSMQVL